MALGAGKTGDAAKDSAREVRKVFGVALKGEFTTFNGEFITVDRQFIMHDADLITIDVNFITLDERLHHSR
jgi:hypothetical protein